jgi:dihydropteroate synthase
MKLRCRDALVSLDTAAVMGVLNVTPDSFSDGGLWLDLDHAVDHGVEMAAEGAAIIDVGGESTRPGAGVVEEAQELGRVVPVVEALVRRVDVPVSIDTRKPEVARRALAVGAAIVNDTRGEDHDSSLDRVAADSGAALILMHSRGSSATMAKLSVYRDVVADVAAWLERRAHEARVNGVPGDAIVVDPGYGFAKTAAQSLELLRRIDVLLDLGYPLLVGTSRKSFIGATLDLEVGERLEGTAATVAWAVAHGAHIVRVHDVRAIVRVVRMIEAIRGVQSDHGPRQQGDEGDLA